LSSRRRVLLASPNHWRSTFQVGSHNLARAFARRGSEVAYLSDPISPLHVATGLSEDLRRRCDSWRRGGVHDSGVWSYVPAAMLTPHNKPILRSERVHRSWHRWTLPNVGELVRRRGFSAVDLLYLDSTQQSCWLDLVEHRRSVYRVADWNPQFAKYTAATERIEREIARRVDLVVYPSRQLGAYAASLGAIPTMFLPNGVDFAHYQTPRPRPPEYAKIPHPIAVYMGVIPEWFHFDAIRKAAAALPKVSFVLIGPPGIARTRLAGLANVHLLGTRDYDVLPGFLQHAEVGLMPFDAERNPEGVAALNPQKMLAYFACGLPVVSTSWTEIRSWSTPARLSESADDFGAGVREAIRDRGDAEALRRFAASSSWDVRLDTLLAELDSPLAVAG
jgi:glycosyltransferase involved in cell wall biosynthesis